MSPNPDNLRRYGLLGASPRLAAWANARPARIAIVQALLLGVLFGIFGALLFYPHRSLGSDVARAAAAAVMFALLMWPFNVRRWRTDHR